MMKNRVLSLVPFFFASFFGLSESRAQLLYQRGSDLLLKDAQGRLSSLGTGFNPVPISDHKFLLIRGAQMGYGEESSCERPAAKNSVVVYDTITNEESLLFDKPLSERMMGHDAACVYEHADLSPSGSTLYAGDLIYCKRLLSKPTKNDPGHPHYPYIHARPDGSRIAIISNEDLALVGGNATAPILRAYLRRIHGRIFVQGEWVP